MSLRRWATLQYSYFWVMLSSQGLSLKDHPTSLPQHHPS